MQVIQNDDGTWRVESGSVIVADGLSNSKAWSIADDRESQSEIQRTENQRRYGRDM